ncbi:hypothetical protein K378_01378 [Streptomyces sp. Amel2xB2]|nr:hypothetical protein [Streptomyces sp. Amel2xB2]RAJ70213.1 hypothetical protein K378_01378 [Streptomyces sp. Amel2xB2]
MNLAIAIALGVAASGGTYALLALREAAATYRHHNTTTKGDGRVR